VAAVHMATGTRVAIKYLLPRLLGDPAFLAAFRAEAELLKGLADRNVVRLYDYLEAPGAAGVDRGAPPGAAQGAAIVMEMVDGVSLHEMINEQGPTTPQAALAVLKGSFLGLAAAHAVGVVHRDYKPENVLVDREGTSKLTDFGVATRTGQTAAGGTPLYMAPEQWDGTPATPASDVYAATAVFFECLTGMTPFSGQLGQLAQQHAFAAVPVELVAEPLRGLIARGMAKDPTTRPDGARALVTELEATAAGAYGPDWEARGRAHLAERAAALMLLLMHGPAAAAGGTGSASTTTALAPKVAASSFLSSHLGLSAGILALVVAAATGGGVFLARGGLHSPGPPPPSAGPASPALPAIAYATTTALYLRSGVTAADELAPLPPGTRASQFTWSWDGRWLGWFSGPANQATDQVHLTDTKTRVTHTWPCASCAVGAFQGDSLLVGGQASLTAYPEDGGPPATVNLPGSALIGSAPEVLTSTPHDASVLYFTGTDISEALYEATSTGAVKLVSTLPLLNGPGDDRVAGGAGLIGLSPDGTILAYGGNFLGGDLGEGSDKVTVVNLVTGTVSTTRLPADPTHPLRVAAVWVDSDHTVYATAWHQPGNGGVGVPPRAVVTPHQYRLANGAWTDTGPRDSAAAGGRDGWLAALEEPGGIIIFSSPVPAPLVATLGTRQVPIASNVTAFAWTP
jgi:hypothetical protein